jgi:methylornithine synthase
MRLEAGANVITSIIPPNKRLAGVSQSSLDIEQGLRTVSEVKKVITAMGLRIASRKVYESWVAERKEITVRREHLGSLCSSETYSHEFTPINDCSLPIL